MRKIWIAVILLSVIAVSVILNCSNGIDQPEGPFVYIDDYWKEEDCCRDSRTTYFVEYHGKTPSEGGYFHLMLKENDGFPIFYGQGKPFEEGNTYFYYETLYVEIDHFDFTGTRNYTLEVEGYGNHYDKYPNTWVRDTWVIPHDSLGTAQCSDCCTNLNDERYFVGCQLHKDNLVGLSTDIEVHFGYPCGYNYGATNYSHMSSLAMVVYDTLLEESEYQGHRPFANIGIGCNRSGGSTDIRYFLITEMNGTYWQYEYHFFDYNTYILEGNIYNVKCSLDINSGIWNYFVNDTSVFDNKYMQDPFWINREGGTYACFMGEIYNMEDDIPGDPSDSCQYSNCKYMIYNDSFDNIDYNDDIRRISFDEFYWGYEWAEPNTFLIWDKYPQIH